MARPRIRSRLINLASSLGNINTPNQYGKFVFENDYLTLDDEEYKDLSRQELMRKILNMSSKKPYFVLEHSCGNTYKLTDVDLVLDIIKGINTYNKGVKISNFKKNKKKSLRLKGADDVYQNYVIATGRNPKTIK